MNDINCNKINIEEYFEEACHGDADVGKPSTNIETVIIREGVNNNMNDIEYNEISSNDTMDDNEINVKEYFEEACHGDAYVEELSMNIETVTIREGKLGRSTMIETGDGKIMRKRTVLCRHSGRYQSTNPTKARKSVKSECQWHVNLSRPFKQNPNNYVYVTTLKDEHNYEMCPEALQFERNKAFTKEMQEDVEFYVKRCRFGATLIRKVLKEKYPSHPIFSKDLYKEIRKHKPSVQVNEATRGQAPGVIITDGDPAMERAIMIEYPTSHHLTCIWHLKENLKKMLRGKLGTEFDAFYSDFWKCRNGNTPEIFNHYWKRYLYERRRSWARGFMPTLFTLGIESTSFVESENACIKCVLESSNTSLCDLAKVLLDRVESRAIEKQYDMINVPLTTNCVTIFPTIEAAVTHYLCPKVTQFTINQMKECVYYTAQHSSIEEIENTPEVEPSESENFEDELDSVLACARLLLHQLHCINIAEI
ncbi:17241_t:CDS:2 [Dentiscutata erythropus]|uniref:17241_t:CDS:1 n=1 Tax=Dentiscutata erythropus TaxID=1348616 RepID=A0A9N9GBY2_9GLOM|nr:17241_t:CDS:2 [Dentiscutata erythropus]